MQLVTGTVVYESGSFRDFGYGPSTSLALKVPGENDLARIWASQEDVDTVQQLAQYKKGQQVQLAKTSHKGKTKYEIVDDGLPFEPKPAAASAENYSTPQQATSKNDQLQQKMQLYTNVEAGAFAWLVSHYKNMIADGKLQEGEQPSLDAIAAQASTVMIQLARNGFLL